MKRRISIGFELSGESFERRLGSLDRWLRCHHAIHVMPSEWILVTPLTVDEIRRELQAFLDPVDRLLVKQVTSMSSQNLIDNDRFGRGAA
jgi:hypothetical protein